MSKSNKRKSSVLNNASQTKRKRRSDADSSIDSDTQDDSMSSPGSSKGLLQRTPIRSGQILGVKLKNFMCHQNLSVDFNRRANLLIGQNGSGKSAVLTALIIGLGSRANATMRSNSIKQFIRTGQQSATIEICISNDGSNAYEKHLYGNRITVCRTITASGASSYKMKNTSGNVITTSRAELIKMIMYMNIQVDNPVCVMTQDASRSFLRDSDPKRHYELFMKATQLDVVIGILDDCVKQITATKSKMETQKSICDKYKEAERVANEKLQRLQSLEPLKQEIKRFKIEQSWVAVVNQEEFIEREINSMLTQTQNQRGVLEEKLSDVMENENNNSLDELIKEIDELKKNLTSNEEKMKADQAIYRRENEEMQSFVRQVKTTEAKIKNIQSIIRKLEENIEEELNSNKSELEDLKASNEAKLTALKSKLQDLEAVIKSHKGEHLVFTGADDKYKSQNDEIQNKKIKLQEDKRHVQRQLANLHAAPKEALRQIADYMPDLIDTIDKMHKAKKFQRKPIGPIANHIEVVHPKYRQFVEDTIGGLMMAFCVDNTDDSKILRQLLKTRFPQAANISIICSRFQDSEYNVSQKCVQRIGKAIPFLELIEVNDPNVKNCLIDQQSIETILFTENINEAQQLTSKLANVPPNLSRVILLSPYSEFFPAPNYRQYAKRSKNARILRLKTENKEQYLRTELMSIDEKIQLLDNEESALGPVIAENRKRLVALSKSIRDSEQEQYLITRQVGDLESFEYPQQAEVSVMQAEVHEQNKILETVTAKSIEEKRTLSEKEQAVKVIEDKLQEMKTNVRNYEKELQEKLKAKDKIEDKLSKREAIIGHYKAKITNANQAIDRLLKELTSAKNKLDRLEAAAKKVGPRIEPTHDEEQLAALIKRNEQKIHTTHKTKETVEELTAQLKEAQEELEKSQMVIENLERSVHLMRTALKLRFKNVKFLKNYMVHRITFIFTGIIKLRSINGTLKFNDEKRTLEIEAVPHAQKNDATVSKTTNLSGGERSYVTVAFLIALWSCVDHPFYFLDEYDVFTDDVNRTYMTKLLLNESKKNKWCQYTFLTPQDASGTENFKDLKILRLANPER